ncbi:MAG: hypothetical protein ABJL99_10500 [Aliishimia sp.]
MSSTPTHITRRRVFYIPGYDPIHPRRYRELYRAEGAEQAGISGYDLKLSAKVPKTSNGAYGWHVDTVIDGKDTHTDIDVLVWSDIVRDSMDNSIPGTYAQMLQTAWAYIGSGALWRLMRLRKGPVIAALYPVGMLILQALVAVLAAWIVYAGVVYVFGFMSPRSVAGLPVLHQVSGLGAGALAAIRVLQKFKALDGKLYVYYLMHDFGYSAASNGANPPELQARMAQFADTIGQALCEDYDEVLVVGHSSGAHLGVSILADLIRSGRVPTQGAELGFLTLGQVVPMVSFLPKADQLRRDLHDLSTRDELTWVDVTAPGDGCAFALCDPVSVSGVAPDGKRWPLVFSAAFTQSLSPEKWSSLKRRFFRLHFQYLCAFDRPRDYDYFQITAGPVSLGTRYKDRPASKSRIDYSVSKYTSRAA